MYKLFEGAFQEEEDPDISEEQLSSLVDATFAEADLGTRILSISNNVDGDNKLSFEEFKGLVSKSPGLIQCMTIGKKK